MLPLFRLVTAALVNFQATVSKIPPGGILETVSVKNVSSHIFKCLIYGKINAVVYVM